jgi:hypothetical protein
MRNPKYDFELLILIAIFMVFWSILTASIFGILENKKIETWKAQSEIISDLKAIIYDR